LQAQNSFEGGAPGAGGSGGARHAEGQGGGDASPGVHGAFLDCAGRGACQ
jgi:hypothetical protein